MMGIGGRWARVRGLVLAGAMLLATPAFAAGVTIVPGMAALPVGGSRQLAAYADGVATTAVVWAVNGTVGGNATVGTVDASGKYTAPSAPPAGWNVTVTATDGSGSSGASVMTVRNQIPWPTSVSPNPLPLGPYTIQVIGSRFVAGAQVLWNGTALPTTFQSSTLLTATGNASQAGSFNLTVANPGPAAVSTALVLKVTSNVTVGVAPASLSLQTNATGQFTATVSNTANTAVIWKVNNVIGGDSGTGWITPAGLYTAPPTVPVGGSVTVSALSVADGSTQASAVVTIQDPLAITNGRFLEQATFGPTSALMARVAEIGIPAFLEEQFGLDPSPLPGPAATRADAVDAFFGNAYGGQDQLRQRVIFALSEILVIAMNKNTNGNEVVPWLDLLSRNAFGNYRTLLEELTLDASMGKYLDLANSGVMGGAANENYPREVMQLFSIGLYRLNLDGSSMLDAFGNSMPTYTQTDVQQLSRALTGWTYGNSTGKPPSYGNYNYYPGPMLPVANRHDNSAKTILGRTLPANQGAWADLEGAIDILFEHPNVGPFLATRLIRALVTSNPSPAYIARVAEAFNDDGNGHRGEMKAVIRAILLDSEARNDTPPPTFGRLRTPVQHTIALARALNLHLGKASGFAYLFYNMNEGMLDAASVFGHYSPSYRVPKPTLFGPEFQIYSASDAVNRANYFYTLLFNPWPINPVLQPFVALAGNPTMLVHAVDTALMLGRMSPSTRSAILNALPAMPDNNARALTALYLAATSGEYLIQR